MTGKNSDASNETKSLAMNQWFFGLEFMETIIMVLRSGHVYILTSAKKIQILEQVKGDKVTLLARAAEDNTEQIKIMFTALQQQEKPGIGLLRKEVHVGAFATSFVQAVEKSGLMVSDFTINISSLLSSKTEQEIQYIKSSSNFAIGIMRNLFIKEIEETIDENLQRSHNSICQGAEAILDNEQQMNKWQQKYQIDPSLCDFVYTCVQSGERFDLRPGLDPDKANLDSRCIVASIGTKYKDYCASLTRTFMVDPSKEQKIVYQTVLDTFNHMVKNIKAGITFEDLFNSGRQQLLQLNKNRGVDISNKIPKNFGHLVGLEFREPHTTVKAGNSAVIERGMCFCLSVGLNGLEAEQGGKKVSYAIWVTDTVVLPLNAGDAIVLTDAVSKKDDEVMYCLDEESEDERAAPKQVEDGIETSNILEEGGVRTRRRCQRQVLDSTSELRAMNARQQELRKQKASAIRAQGTIGTSSTSTQKEKEGQKLRRLDTICSYQSPSSIPKEVRPCKCYVDMKNESIILPIAGSMVPFHVRTIKNVVRPPTENGTHFLRLNFHTPGAGGTQEVFPALTAPRSVFLKEINYKTEDDKNISLVIRQIKELQKRLRNANSVQSGPDIKQQATIKFLKGKRPTLRDLNIRPNVKTHGRAIGNLEAHENGFRFTASKGECVDVIYSNIKHAIFQPCENDLMVLIHFHLKDEIIINKKKVQDVQFFTEVGSQADDLKNYRRVGADPDEIMEEERERQLRQKINTVFKEFVQSVEQISRLEFDLPYRELGFVGVPFRGAVDIFPCRDCLASISEAPPFVLTLSEVDIVYFERVTFTHRNFDIAFIFKDLKRTVCRISTVPMECLDKLKTWLGELEIVWYEGAMNMKWPAVFKEIENNPEQFAVGGGWESIFGDQDDASEEDEMEVLDSSYSDEDFEEDDSEDDFEMVEEESEDDDVPSDEEDGMSWDELERQAHEDDREARVEKRQQQGKEGEDPDSKRRK